MIKKLNVLDYISIVLSLAQTTSSIIFITFVLRYATFSKATIIFASVALIKLSLVTKSPDKYAGKIFLPEHIMRQLLEEG